MKCKIKDFFYYISLLACFTFASSSIILQVTYYKFSGENVKNNIQTLTSPQYEGRLTGSFGSYACSNVIENSFKCCNLLPFNNNYRESFEVLTPVLNNTRPELSIKNNSKIIREYKYGVDYKEDMINFRTFNSTFSKNDNIAICLNSIVITQNNHKYLFHVNTNKNFDFRSSFNANSEYDFCINITTEIYNDILDSIRNNCTLTVNLPYTVTTKYAYNILGTIKGTSSSLPPLIITAHYDHLGKDYLGNYYNGALDNASGTAFMLELSKNISSLIKPKRSIIFIGFTGEEFGLLGSKAFVNTHLSEIKNATVINLDMIGAPNTPITFMNGTCFKNNNSQNTIMSSLKDICIKKSIDYKVEYNDCSDHASFCNSGINAITLCNSDVSRIHTPNDTIDHIDTSTIDTVYSLIQPEIYNLAYNKYILLLYKPIFTIFCFLIFIILYLFPYIKNKYNNKK